VGGHSCGLSTPQSSLAMSYGESRRAGGLSTVSLGQYLTHHNLPVMMAKAIESAALARADCPVAAVYNQLKSSTSPLILRMVRAHSLSRTLSECAEVLLWDASRVSHSTLSSYHMSGSALDRGVLQEQSARQLGAGFVRVQCGLSVEAARSWC
jgi:hypothetical protein